MKDTSWSNMTPNFQVSTLETSKHKLHHLALFCQRGTLAFKVQHISALIPNCSREMALCASEFFLIKGVFPSHS